MIQSLLFSVPFLSRTGWYMCFGFRPKLYSPLRSNGLSRQASIFPEAIYLLIVSELIHKIFVRYLDVPGSVR